MAQAAFLPSGEIVKVAVNINYKQKISQKWGEKPHFRLIFGLDDRSRTCLGQFPNAKNLIFLRDFTGFSGLFSPD